MLPWARGYSESESDLDASLLEPRHPPTLKMHLPLPNAICSIDVRRINMVSVAKPETFEFSWRQIPAQAARRYRLLHFRPSLVQVQVILIKDT